GGRLLADQDVAQPLEVVQRVVDRQHGAAGQAEDDLHALALQALQNDSRPWQLQFTLPVSLRIRRVLGRRLPGLDPRLRRAQARDRNHERGARHVGHAHPVTELHRGRLAAVLAADAHLEIGTGPATTLDPDLDELSDTFLIENTERIVTQQAFL